KDDASSIQLGLPKARSVWRLNVDLTMLVWEDGGYGLIAWKQENEFKRHTDLAFGNPNWMELASSFGWTGHQVTRGSELKGALERALSEAGPSLVVMPVDYRENPKLTKKLGELTASI
ncbi:MAG: thiamine pyrophosphate-dependent enzyme, partial [Pseudomonadota bacterium]